MCGDKVERRLNKMFHGPWYMERRRRQSSRGHDAGAASRNRTARSGGLGFEESRHALPGLVGAGDVVGGAAFVGKRMRRVVAVDLMRDAGCLQRTFELIDRGGRAPIVAVGEMAL